MAQVGPNAGHPGPPGASAPGNNSGPPPNEKQLDRNTGHYVERVRATDVLKAMQHAGTAQHHTCCFHCGETASTGHRHAWRECKAPCLFSAGDPQHLPHFGQPCPKLMHVANADWCWAHVRDDLAAERAACRDPTKVERNQARRVAQRNERTSASFPSGYQERGGVSSVSRAEYYRMAKPSRRERSPPADSGYREYRDRSDSSRAPSAATTWANMRTSQAPPPAQQQAQPLTPAATEEPWEMGIAQFAASFHGDIQLFAHRLQIWCQRRLPAQPTVQSTAQHVQPRTAADIHPGGAWQAEGQQSHDAERARNYVDVRSLQHSMHAFEHVDMANDRWNPTEAGFQQNRGGMPLPAQTMVQSSQGSSLPAQYGNQPPMFFIGGAPPQAPVQQVPQYPRPADPRESAEYPSETYAYVRVKREPTE